jgi:hypothetical protein
MYSAEVVRLYTDYDGLLDLHWLESNATTARSLAYAQQAAAAYVAAVIER